MFGWKHMMAALSLCLLFLLACGSSALAAEQTLVNKTYPLQEGDNPQDLVELNSFLYAVSGASMDREAAQALGQMAADLELSGAGRIYAVSGYRSYGLQDTLYENKTNFFLRLGYGVDEALDEAGRVVAPPGASEHQTGFAIDVDCYGHSTNLTEAVAHTSEGQWLAAHCQEYGFILRFPKEKTGITGYIYEPWHFRYVGRPHSMYIMANDLCLEEYLDLLKEKQGLHLQDEGKEYLIYFLPDIEDAARLPWSEKTLSVFRPGGREVIVTATPTNAEIKEFLLQEDLAEIQATALDSVFSHQTQGWTPCRLTAIEGLEQLLHYYMEENGWPELLERTLALALGEA